MVSDHCATSPRHRLRLPRWWKVPSLSYMPSSSRAVDIPTEMEGSVECISTRMPGV